jgi:3,8-divinyl chlorophyllide a/chlorophyllide a reductase subunit Z
MGMPCAFAIARTAGTKSDNAAVRTAIHTNPPLVLFGSFNERMYGAEAGSRSMFVPASFPGAVIRRHTGTPFMGYAGATYLIQEVCNALFDALFNILPLGTVLDKVEATPARTLTELAWDVTAKDSLDAAVERAPVLVRISMAKRIRDAAERAARRAGEAVVTQARVDEAMHETMQGAGA